MIAENQDQSQVLQVVAIPGPFLDGLIGTVSSAGWQCLMEARPEVRTALAQGFSAKPGKLLRLLQHPELHSRLRRLLQHDPALLAATLEVWGQEHLPLLSFLEMVQPDFLLEYLEDFRDFLGPGELFGGLFLLGCLARERFRERITPAFWERSVQPTPPEALTPTLAVCEMTLRNTPQTREWFAGLASALQPGGARELSEHESAREFRHKWRQEEERRQRVEQKLHKAQEEKERLAEQGARQREEIESLRRQLGEWQEGFERKLRAAIGNHRRGWFARYEPVDEQAFREADGRLESLLAKAERAMALQRAADAHHGSISALAEKLFKVELTLREIERIHADSLVVHAEVTKVKEALLQERDKIRCLPGLERVFRQEPQLNSRENLEQQVHLLEPVAENLPRVMRFEELLQHCRDVGLSEGLGGLEDALKHKKRQILETIYARFPARQESPEEPSNLRSLEELTRSGAAKAFDVYVDGYNILLTVRSSAQEASPASLGAMREHFIAALCARSHWFHQVHLVFDGVQESRERRGNVEIIYADKTRGETADAFILEALRRAAPSRRKLLVTADREIIAGSEGRFYALVDPADFYAFILDIPFPAWES
jgi:hypothetical protein